MKKKLRYLYILFLILFFTNSFLFCNILKVRLEKFGTYGILPASFVNVTLSKKSGKNLKTELTGSDGIYNFHDIDPGIYVLKIWANGFDNKPVTYEVEVLDESLTDTKPFLIHYFEFEFPKEKERFPRNSNITAKGIYYNFPDDAYVWIVLKCVNENYLLSTKKPIYIKKNGKWESSEILLDRQIKEILAVLVTKTGHGRFRAFNNYLHEFHQLPQDSFIVAARKIILN